MTTSHLQRVRLAHTPPPLAHTPPQQKQDTTPVSAKIDQASYQVISAVAAARRDTGKRGTSPAAVIRDALDSYFKDRLADPDLEERMAIATERHEAILAGVKAGQPDTKLRELMPAPIPVALGKQRAVTVRVGERTLRLLEAFALIDGTGMADQLRMAVTQFVNPLREDPVIARELARIEEANQSLAALGG